MKYYVRITCSGAEVNDLSSTVDKLLRSAYGGKIIDGASLKSLYEATRLSIAEVNAQYKNTCEPINDISHSDINGPRFYVAGPQGFFLTFEFFPIKGDLIF